MYCNEVRKEDVRVSCNHRHCAYYLRGIQEFNTIKIMKRKRVVITEAARIEDDTILLMVEFKLVWGRA